MSKNSKNQFWGKWDLPVGKTTFKGIGDLRIWIERDAFEIKIAYIHREPDSVEDSTVPDNVTWHRWAFRTDNPVIELKPIFPDRPVLVKPEAAFRVAEDARVLIYVRVPIWVNVLLSGKNPTSLMEIPTVILSNTWFGSFADGDLCYWISSGARREIEVDPTRRYLAICPVHLIDESPEDLNVEKICLRVANLSLFLDKNQLWSDVTKVTYKGKTDVSQVEVTGKVPAEAKAAKRVSTPREPIKKAFTAKTFSTLKDLPGIGLFVK